MLCVFWIQIALITSVLAFKQPHFQKLPSLQDQATIQDAWTKERISNIPQILQKYNVGAWLVCLL